MQWCQRKLLVAVVNFYSVFCFQSAEKFFLFACLTPKCALKLIYQTLLSALLEIGVTWQPYSLASFDGVRERKQAKNLSQTERMN